MIASYALVLERCRHYSKIESLSAINLYLPVPSTFNETKKILQNCKSSCIDNILTNKIENTVLSGVIEERLGDHSPIFAFASVETTRNTEPQKHVCYYDYSSSKLKSFVTDFEVKVNQLTPSKPLFWS